MVQRKIWTPGGDVSVGDTTPSPSAAPASSTSGDATIGGQSTREFSAADDAAELTSEQREMLAAIEQLQNTPVIEIVLNQAVSLYQVATLHVQTGRLGEARLAVAALSALLEVAQPELATTEDGASAMMELRLNGLYLDAVANLEPGRAVEAKAAIDALAAYVDEERDTLGPAATKLEEELVTLRLAYADRFGSTDN